MIIEKTWTEKSTLVNKEGIKKTRIWFGVRKTTERRIYNSKKVP